jgi:hypothetical protein
MTANLHTIISFGVQFCGSEAASFVLSGSDVLRRYTHNHERRAVPTSLISHNGDNFNTRSLLNSNALS